VHPDLHTRWHALDAFPLFGRCTRRRPFAWLARRLSCFPPTYRLVRNTQPAALLLHSLALPRSQPNASLSRLPAALQNLPGSAFHQTLYIKYFLPSTLVCPALHVHLILCSRRQQRALLLKGRPRHRRITIRSASQFQQATPQKIKT